MRNKGYTIMEAVIAMFLVVVMVGAVFSALMSSRRAMVASSEKEEVYYALYSAYGLIKDCRANTKCGLANWKCRQFLNSVADISSCNQLFTFNFDNLCKRNESGNSGEFSYELSSLPSVNSPQAWFSSSPGQWDEHVAPLMNFNVLNIQANCQEAL